MTMFVKYTDLSDYCPWSRKPYISRPAWRVGWLIGRVEWFHEIPFPRKRDAENAIKAMIAAGVTDGDLQKLPEGSDLTIGPLETVMLEALQW